MAIGKQPEMGHIPGTLAKVTTWGGSQDFPGFRSTLLSRRRVPPMGAWAPLQGRILGVQGVVDHCAPAVGWEMPTVGMSVSPHFSVGKGPLLRSLIHFGSSKLVGSDSAGSDMDSGS